MKRSTLLLVFVIAGFSAANAQNFVNTGSGVNQVDKDDERENAGPAKSEPSPKVIYSDPYSMEHITMEEEENAIRFDNLPDIAMTLHITDGNGNEVITKKLSKKTGGANVKGLKKGIHFVTLTSDNTNNRKTFTLNRN